MSSVMPRCRNALIALSAATLVAACGGGSSEPTGRVSVGLTDTPSPDVTEVVVHVTGVAFKPQGAAPEIVLDFEPRSIDLLQYQNGKVASLLEEVPIRAGRYEWLRLLMDAEPVVGDSYVTTSSGECELLIPSGAESGLKMNRPIDIPEGVSVALTIDFDVMQSIRMPPGQATNCEVGYKLRPTLRLVVNTEVGAIEGVVESGTGTVDGNCAAPAVYIFEGDVTPDDKNEPAHGAEPLVIRRVEVPDGDTRGYYLQQFLPAGNYTVALTCRADDDTPEGDEDLEFIRPDGFDGGVVTVQTNMVTTANFTVPAPPT